MNTKRMRLEGHWQEAKGRIRSVWGDLTDDELDEARGAWEQLVGTIRRKTGESIEKVESTLDEIAEALQAEPAR